VNFAAHYVEAAPVIRAWALDEELGEIERPGKHGHKGVYKTVRHGEERLGLPWGLARDLGPLSAKHRTLYGYLNFVRPGFFASPSRFEEGEDGKVWVDGKPLPGYSDIEAFSLWADVDLRDKEARFDAETQAVVEEAMRFMASEFRALCPNSVRLLDSGGGFYPHIHHKTTRGLAMAFEGEERGLIFDALTDRFNTWLGDVESRLFEAVPEAEAVLKVDKVNHKNRVVKAPLSVHGSLDVVVHPVPDLDSPDFDAEPFPMRPGLVEEALEWVEKRPSDGEAAEDLQNLVLTLWPDVEGSSGRERLENWLEEKREEEARKAERRRAMAARREERQAQGRGIGDLELTPFMEDVFAAVDAVDVQEVAQDYAAEWDTDKGRDPPRFAPPWRESDSGTSCFASPDSFGDVAEGGGGDAAKFVARAAGIVSVSSQSLAGAEWWEAVEILRQDGHQVPVFVPSMEEDQKTPLFAVREVAVALEVVEESDFVEREAEDGGTYQGFPDYETYHQTLHALEKRDIEHGREPLLERLRKLRRQAEKEYEKLAGVSP